MEQGDEGQVERALRAVPKAGKGFITKIFAKAAARFICRGLWTESFPRRRGNGAGSMYFPRGIFQPIRVLASGAVTTLMRGPLIKQSVVTVYPRHLKALPFLLPQIEGYPRAGTGLAVSDFHLLQLVVAVDFLYASGIKSFHNFTARVIGIGMNDPMG